METVAQRRRCWDWQASCCWRCPSSVVRWSRRSRPPRGGRLPRLRSAGRAVTLIWVKRIWRCVEPACAVATWTERSQAIRPRASLTERARREACRRVGQDGHTVAQVAGQLGVGWATVMAAVIEYGLPLIDEPSRLAGVTMTGSPDGGPTVVRVRCPMMGDGGLGIDEWTAPAAHAGTDHPKVA